MNIFRMISVYSRVFWWLFRVDSPALDGSDGLAGAGFLFMDMAPPVFDPPALEPPPFEPLPVGAIDGDVEDEGMAGAFDITCPF